MAMNKTSSSVLERSRGVGTCVLQSFRRCSRPECGAFKFYFHVFLRLYLIFMLQGKLLRKRFQ